MLHKTTKLVCLIFLWVLPYNFLSQSNLYPEEHLGFNFVSHQAEDQGYFLLTPLFLASGPSDSLKVKSSLSIIDHQGNLIWYSRSGTDIFTGFDYYSFSSSYSFWMRRTNGERYKIVMDTSFNVVDTISNLISDYESHEFRITPQGSVLSSGEKDSIMDLSSFVFNGSSGPINATAIGFVVEEIINDSLIFSWNSNDHIHPSEMVDGYIQATNPNKFDYAHGNSIDKDSSGNYLVSLRHTDAVYKIDLNGEIIWRLGGENSDFTFPNDRGFSGQHDARFINDSVVSLFDNSNNHFPHYSRGVIYYLDTNNWEAVKLSEHSYHDTVYGRAMGSFVIDSDDGTVINYGWNYRPSPSFIHNDEFNNLISELFFEDTVVSYRCKYKNQQLPGLELRPNIQCENVTGGIKLSVTNHDRIIWNTGEQNSSIVATADGIYFCWVDFGIGMLLSESIVVDLSESCQNTSNVYSLEYKDVDEIIGVYDLLGRPIYRLEPNNIYLRIYKSGKVEKFFCLDSN